MLTRVCRVVVLFDHPASVPSSLCDLITYNQCALPMLLTIDPLTNVAGPVSPSDLAKSMLSVCLKVPFVDAAITVSVDAATVQAVVLEFAIECGTLAIWKAPCIAPQARPASILPLTLVNIAIGPLHPAHAIRPIVEVVAKVLRAITVLIKTQTLLLVRLPEARVDST